MPPPPNPHRTRPPNKSKSPPWWKGPWKLLKSSISPIPSPTELYHLVVELLTDPRRCLPIMTLLLLVEVVVNSLIVLRVQYTEIDWKAYMQEVEGFWNGTTDYEKLHGDTGPLVYPAGFVYFFLGLYHLTSKGEDIRLAQWMFVGFYVAFIVAVFRIHRKSAAVPPWAFVFMCCASYRVHSLFALRLFNDPIAMLFFFVSLNFILEEYWTIGCLVFSFAVSVKMNVLLFSPALGLVLLNKVGWRRLFLLIFLCAALQLLVGAPFLIENPRGYILRSFELSRQFLYKWTVNWRCIPEWLFLDRNFQLLLLFSHVSSLLLFAHFRWTASPLLPGGGGIMQFFKDPQKINFSQNEVISMFFVSNMIGVTFARSLHYQFYVWYYHTLYFLLWHGTRISSAVRLTILGFIELAWNTYPSTVYSSNILHFCHGLILLLLFQKDSLKPREEEEVTIRAKAKAE